MTCSRCIKYRREMENTMVNTDKCPNCGELVICFEHMRDFK